MSDDANLDLEGVLREIDAGYLRSALEASRMPMRALEASPLPQGPRLLAMLRDPALRPARPDQDEGAL